MRKGPQRLGRLCLLDRRKSAFQHAPHMPGDHQIFVGRYDEHRHRTRCARNRRLVRGITVVFKNDPEPTPIAADTGADFGGMLPLRLRPIVPTPGWSSPISATAPDPGVILDLLQHEGLTAAAMPTMRPAKGSNADVPLEDAIYPKIFCHSKARL
jgi:hypothetical protein